MSQIPPAAGMDRAAAPAPDQYPVLQDGDSSGDVELEPADLSAGDTDTPAGEQP